MSFLSEIIPHDDLEGKWVKLAYAIGTIFLSDIERKGPYRFSAEGYKIHGERNV